MAHANVDMGLLQNTNITDKVYARKSEIFCIILLDTPIRHCESMALCYKESTRFVVEAHEQHGPNAISFQLVTGGQR